MRNKIVLAAFLLCACETTQTAPEAATVTKIVERLVPVIKPCEATIGPKPDVTATPRSSVEEKVDAAALEILALNKYVAELQIGFVSCGGKIQ